MGRAVVQFFGFFVPWTLLTLVTVFGASVGSKGDATTCQCGVFLLGSPPLHFSADATPALAGNPVAANCSSLPDRTRCSSSCRQLVQAMSNQDDSPLVQTVVLAATRALACQKFNSSAKVPLPRIHIATPMGWRLDSERNLKMSEPRWLGGFYRWCDSHWVYAGVSVSDPLCCANGLPTKCRDSAGEDVTGNANSSRNPRLIIKKRPEDDLSSEENDNDLDVTASTTSTTTETSVDLNNTSMEKLEPLAPSPTPSTESKLNSTILAEAFQFVGALMRSMGMSDVVEGITTVLPTSTATELLKKVDVGGWVGKYQDRYIVYGREFNMGYCYLEYGLYNVASEGVGNLVSRVFGGGKTNRRVRRASTNTPPRSQPKFVPSSLRAAVGSSPKADARQRKSTNATKRQSGNQQGPNLMNMANMLMTLAGGASEGDKVNALLQNALPLMGSVATSPMIQGVVSNLVTSFLTPPAENNNNNGQRPQNKPHQDDNNELEPLNRPSSNSQQQQQPSRPQQRPQQDAGQQESGLTSMLGQIVQTYLKHYFSSKNPPPPPPTATAPPKTTRNPEKTSSQSATTPTQTPAEEKTDIVDTISEVAKPFFISYFGVVPGIPGFGQLNIAERTGRVRDDTLTYDPDPGSSLADLVFGSVNLPQTGNGIFDFGNRVAFAFSRANDPTQGLYCFKQYSVNKLWDGFRFGVKTLFK